MKKYFYTDGTNSFGPMDLEELKSKNITKETNVWFEELGDWKPAGTVPELSSLFEVVPPTPEPVATEAEPVLEPKTTVVESIPEPVQKSTQDSQQKSFQDQYSKSVGTPPKTYLVESILVTLFCCWPFGVAGIVNASKVESKFNSGDISGAQEASEKAKKWTIVSLVSGLVVIVLYFIFVVVLGVAGEL